MTAGESNRPSGNQLAAEVGMNVLQTYRTQKAAAVADAARISRGQTGTLILPAAVHSTGNRPIIRSKLRPDRTKVLRILRTDETSQRKSFRKVQCVHRKEAMNPGFAAGIEGHAVETVAGAAPVSAKDPVQPKCRSGRGLRIRQLKLSVRGAVAEMQIIE